MATWAYAYDQIVFRVGPYLDCFALWRVRLWKRAEVYRTLVYTSTDQDALEQDAGHWQRTCAAMNSLYRVTEEAA